MRGKWKELIDLSDDVTATGATLIKDLVDKKQILASYVDFDRKARGEALNYTMYGYDLPRGLFVYQARQSSRLVEGGYWSQRKTYALAGRNENAAPFWHPVSSGAVQAGIRINGDDPSYVVDRAIAWIFQVDMPKLSTIARQGDVALVPARPRGKARDDVEATLVDTHILTARELRDDDGTIYALDPHLRHSRAQHSDVSACGWCRVAVGRVYRAWDFSPRSID